MRILCLDVGTKTIGVAVSDPTGMIAQGIKTIRRGPSEWDELKNLVTEYEVQEIIVGLPLNMDGSEGSQATFVRKFTKFLTSKFPELPISMLDERLSTVAAERQLLEADLSREKRKGVINHMAAAYVLQGYLDQRFPPPAYHGDDE
jgi:putative Holliday junction resolvase